MSVKYRKVVNNRQGSPTQGKIYGRAVINDVIHTKKIAEQISKRCTVTEPDVLAVINALESEIADNLSNGNRIVLDGFGSFKVGLTTTPADTPKKFTSANIKAMHVVFAPAVEVDQKKRVKPMLRGVKTEELVEYNGLEDAEGGTPSGDNKPSGGTPSGDNKPADDNKPSGNNPGGSGSGTENPGSGNPGTEEADGSISL